MRDRYSLGDVVRLTLDLISGGAGATGQSPTIAIQRRSDSKWFQDSDHTWQVGFVANAMTATDATNLPGRYHFDFDSKYDDLGAREFTVKKVNAGSPLALVYEEIAFGPLAASITPGLCAVTGTIFAADAKRSRTEIVRATLVPVMKDDLGRAYQCDRVIQVTTDVNGDFSLPLVRGGTFRLEIPSIGYDRKVIIPNASSALFTDL